MAPLPPASTLPVPLPPPLPRSLAASHTSLWFILKEHRAPQSHAVQSPGRIIDQYIRPLPVSVGHAVHQKDNERPAPDCSCRGTRARQRGKAPGLQTRCGLAASDTRQKEKGLLFFFFLMKHQFF